MTDTLHPARSTEFLSSLYDAELPSADRAAFEAHRSACDECRAAADAFAATLAAFRASPTPPPAADLSARILRKIRAQSPSRRPFGVMFGIDVRWAGVVVAALLVVLISTPLVVRRKEAAVLPSSSIPATILDAPEQPAAPEPQARNSAKSEAARGAAALAPAPAQLSRDALPAANLAEAPHPQAASGAASADEARRRDAEPPRVAPGPPMVAATPAQLSVRASDGNGPAPAIVSQPPDTRLAGLRGLAFLVTVDARGRVTKVEPSATGGLASSGKSAPADRDPGAGHESILRELRFAAGDGERRLLVQVE